MAVYGAPTVAALWVGFRNPGAHSSGERKSYFHISAIFGPLQKTDLILFPIQAEEKAPILHCPKMSCEFSHPRPTIIFHLIEIPG